jgi:hypothetical protein
MKKMLFICLGLIVALSACGPLVPGTNDFPSPPAPSLTAPATELPAPAVQPEQPTATPALIRPIGAPTVPLTPVSGGGYPEVVFIAREALAKQLGLPVDQITIVNIVPVDWPDGCLGVSNPEMMCTMVITPGYRVVLSANGQNYEAHTNTRSAVVFTRPGPPFGP